LERVDEIFAIRPEGKDEDADLGNALILAVSQTSL
jgi:hypothetical protein